MTTIWTADSDGTGLRQLGTVPSTLVAVSPRGHVAYVERPTGLTAPGVFIADFDTETEEHVGEAPIIFVPWEAVSWRPQ